MSITYKVKGDPLTIAYMAGGAFEALRNSREISQEEYEAAIAKYEGELGIIEEIINQSEWLEKAYKNREPGQASGVFLYDCAEPYGAALARLLVLEPDTYSPDKIAKSVIAHA